MKLLSVLDHSSRLRVAPRPSHSSSPVDLAELAAAIDRDGIDIVAPEILADLARRAGAGGLHPEVAAVIIDPSAPPVVRDRVFGLIHRRLTTEPLGTEPAAVAA